MAKNNQEFLQFSAYSIKNLITRKLTDSTAFTDQVYEGSNLAILIDIFSHMAQCILYALNNTAAESMFSDTAIYENMNRLIKFIGYNPKGYSPATIEMAVDTTNLNLTNTNNIIYKYSVIDTGKTDLAGKRIYFSTIDDVYVNSNEEFSTLFYNGIWKLHDETFVSNGGTYQKFTLMDAKSDSSIDLPVDERTYTADKFVHVYVQEPGTTKLEQYKCVTEGLFTDNNIENGSYIYKSIDPIFNLRLNENKTYEITFGNGFTGKIPPEDSIIYVMYLDSNGPDAKIDQNELADVKIDHGNYLFGLTDEMYQEMFNITESDKDVNGNFVSPLYSEQAKWRNITSSTEAALEEDVDEIRLNAPEWFKTGNRLVTASDFEYYVKNRFRDNIVDVKCQNNWQYISTFYQWLYNLGLNGQRTILASTDEGYRQPNETYYINTYRLQKHDLKYADAADGNNVYLWIKMKNDADIYKDLIDEEIVNIKTLTQEAVYVKPIDVYFTPSAIDKSDALKNLIHGNNAQISYNDLDNSYIEITLEDNVLYSSSDIQNKVANIIREFFAEKNFNLGQTVDFATLTNKILNLSNVSRIRTIWRDINTGYSRIINGMSFATWSADLIDIGDDIEVSSVSRTMEVFQFPKLYMSADISKRIKVIKKSISNVSSIQY